MLRRLCLASAIAVLCVLPLMAQGDVAESDWFPAAVGMSWTYRVADGKIVVKVTKHEKQSGLMCARFETIDKGEVVAAQDVAIDADKVLRVAHNGEKVEPPFMLMKLPAAKGQKWKVDSKMTSRSGSDVIQGKFATDEEDVKVPAGEFKNAIRVTADITIDGNMTSIKSWYAPKVGLIKQRIVIGTQSHVMELEKVEFPK
jgi:hypothetical protein